MLLGSMPPRATAAILLITLVLWSGVRPKERSLHHACMQPHQGSLCEHDVSRPSYSLDAAAPVHCCPVRQVTSPWFMNETCCLLQAPREEAVSLSYAREGTPPPIASPQIEAETAASPAVALFSPLKLRCGGCRDVFDLKTDLRI
jgi:hypothetical protein